jgi:octaprenyl-diphosphate synthase
MRLTLDQIKQPVAKELAAFETHFREALRSDVALLDKITYYIVRRKGKQIRPVFVFLAARMHGECAEPTFHAASLVELLHTATLVHDDVVDESQMRRGFFSINALWKNKIAVLVGDYLLSRGLLLALDNNQYELLHILSRAVRDMSEGELLQLEKARRLDIAEPVYYDIIRQKTASLIAAACAAGAASTQKDPDVTQRMFNFGEKIGMAFQIKDDLLDFGEDQTGKPKGIDVKEKKLTLPLIYALSQTDAAQKRRFLRMIKNDSESGSTFDAVYQLILDKGGLAYARERMSIYREEAFAILHAFPDSPSRQSLEQLVGFVTDRKF